MIYQTAVLCNNLKIITNVKVALKVDLSFSMGAGGSIQLSLKSLPSWHCYQIDTSVVGAPQCSVFLSHLALRTLGVSISSQRDVLLPKLSMF